MSLIRGINTAEPGTRTTVREHNSPTLSNYNSTTTETRTRFSTASLMISEAPTLCPEVSPTLPWTVSDYPPRALWQGVEHRRIRNSEAKRLSIDSTAACSPQPACPAGEPPGSRPGLYTCDEAGKTHISAATHAMAATLSAAEVVTPAKTALFAQGGYLTFPAGTAIFCNYSI